MLGVEQVEEAVEDARRNAGRNGIGNCQFLAGPAETLLGELQEQGRRFDLVVVDPPRVGIHHKALAALGGLQPPEVLYVSCNPEALADDLAELVGLGYELAMVQPVDLFPQTPHCEVLVRLTSR